MFIDRVKDQIEVEYETLRRLGLKSVFGRIAGATPDWQVKLPVQKARIYTIKDLQFSVLQDILTHLAKEKISFSQGGHSLYLSPSQWKKSVFAPLAEDYPASAGLKIMKRLGGLNSPYLFAKGFSRIQAKFIPSHRHQVLTNNGLHILDIAPRLYDLLEIDGVDNIATAYVVEHIEGNTPPAEECQELVNNLKSFVDDGTLQLIATKGFDHNDFKYPHFNGNIIKDKNTKKMFYIDVQNFRFTHYDRFLKDIALKARKDSHFGDKSFVLGGKYLYQSVPGLHISAQRDPEERINTIMSLLKDNGITIKEKVILDIGCNIGLTSAQYLRHGAKWVHGWDIERVVKHTERILLGVGCTRFSLTGKKLNAESNITEDIPQFLKDKEVIISYLAIRKHIGWMRDIANIKWRYMIYEGHAREPEEDTIKFVKQLNEIVKTKILTQSVIKDANSPERTMAIIERL
jgi:hypothetical protein